MPTPVTSSTSRRLIIVLAALGVLATLIAAVVLGKSASKDEEKSDRIAGGFHELRRDEFGEAILAAREKAHTWTYLEVNTVDGQMRRMTEGKVDWEGGDDYDLSIAPQGSSAGEFRLVDGTWYFNNSAQAKTRPWLELDPKSAQVFIDAMTKEADPRRQAAVFDEPSGFQVLGVENIGTAVGVHYRVTVPIERVKEATGSVVVGDPGDQQVYDVWLDKDDNIVKLVQPNTIGTVETSVVRTFSGFGEPVDITAPPADQLNPTPVKVKPRV